MPKPKANIVNFEPTAEESDFQEVTGEANSLFKKLKELPEHRHLRNFRVKLIFTTKEMKSAGKRVLGKAMKCSERDKFLHGHDFLIILDREIWENVAEYREPLLYHEMCHCGIDDKEQPTIVAHDVEEFGSVIQRYGMWKSDVKEFCQQMELFNRSSAQG